MERHLRFHEHFCIKMPVIPIILLLACSYLFSSGNSEGPRTLTPEQRNTIHMLIAKHDE